MIGRVKRLLTEREKIFVSCLSDMELIFRIHSIHNELKKTNNERIGTPPHTKKIIVTQSMNGRMV